MPKIDSIKKTLVLGSGPIIIGQAAEFDYSGTQACQALKEEGIEVVLVNSNPATIMTDKEVADKIYIEPLTIEFIEKIIEKEKIEAVLISGDIYDRSIPPADAVDILNKFLNTLIKILKI